MYGGAIVVSKPVDLTQYGEGIRPAAAAEISPELRNEIVERLRRIEAGEESFKSHEEVMKELGLDLHEVVDVLE